MITIGLSSVTPDATILPVVGAERQKRVLVWIPATIGLGLLIGAIYLGARIITTHRTSAPRLAHLDVPTRLNQVTPPPPAIPPPPILMDTAQSTSPNLDDTLIIPQAGQRYLQVAALDPKASHRFVQHLRTDKLEPRIAPGPNAALLRILLGPFDNRDALIEAKAQLQSEGLDAFVREY